MLSILDLLLLVLTARCVVAGPMRRYLNTTSTTSGPTPAGPMPQLHRITSSSSTTDIIFSFLSGPATTLSDFSSGPCESMSTAAAQGQSQGGQGFAHLGSTTLVDSTSALPQATSASAKPMHNTTSTTLGHGHRPHKTAKQHPSSKITLASSIMPSRQSGAANVRPTATSSISQALNSTLAATTKAGSRGTSTGLQSASSSPVTWGTLTLTYQMPSSSSAGITSASSAFAYPTQTNTSPTAAAGSAQALTSIGALTPSFSLPSTSAITTFPTFTFAPWSQQISSMTTSSSKSVTPTTDVVASASTSSTPDSFWPPLHHSPPFGPQSNHGLPPIVTQPMITPTPAPLAPTLTTSGADGITIVPVIPGNSAATTVYVTVTTTEPGWTTTVAEQTITAGWW